MFAEPRGASAPSILTRLGPVTGPVVCEEGMGRAGINHELCRLPGCLESTLHLLDIGDGNSEIFPAIETQDGTVDLRSDVEWPDRPDPGRFGRPELAVPGNRSSDFATVGCEEEGIHPSPAESCHADSIRSPRRMLFSIGHQGIQVPHDLLVRNRVNDLSYGFDVGQVQDASFTRVRLKRQTQEAFFGKAAGYILDVL